MTHSILFRSANLPDPLQTYLLGMHDVLIEDGLVKEISDKPIKSSSAQVIDVAGKTLMHGLIDLHVHIMVCQLTVSPRSQMSERRDFNLLKFIGMQA